MNNLKPVCYNPNSYLLFSKKLRMAGLCGISDGKQTVFLPLQNHTTAWQAFFLPLWVSALSKNTFFQLLRDHTMAKKTFGKPLYGHAMPKKMVFLPLYGPAMAEKMNVFSAIYVSMPSKLFCERFYSTKILKQIIN